MRAAKAAGREVFGYNRSIDGVEAARFDGYDATDVLDDVLARAAATDALIVLAVPVPALPIMLEHIRSAAPQCALTDVTSVKGAVLQAVQDHGLIDRFVGGHPMAGTAHSGWAAGDERLFVGAPWVISVDDHVDPDVWAKVMHLALDCGAVVVPARSDEHDAAAAAISHLPHLLAEALAVTAADVPLAFALAAGSFRDGTRVAGDRARSGPGHVRGELRTAARRPGPHDRPAHPGPRRPGRRAAGGRPRRGRTRRTDALRQLQQAGDPHGHDRRRELARRTGRRRPRGRRDQIRSASPG